MMTMKKRSASARAKPGSRAKASVSSLWDPKIEQFYHIPPRFSGMFDGGKWLCFFVATHGFPLEILTKFQTL